MIELTRDGTAESVWRDFIIRRERGQGKNIFLVQLTTASRIGNLPRVIHTRLRVMTTHTFIDTYIHTYITPTGRFGVYYTPLLDGIFQTYEGCQKVFLCAYR